MLKSSMNRLQIHLRGHLCNRWPMLDITLNDRCYHRGEISGDLNLDIPLREGRNLLAMEHYGKRFGEGRVWDTKSRDGAIVEDRRIEVLSITIDGIDFRDKLHGMIYTQKPVTGEPTAPLQWDGNFNFNGIVLLDIDPTPLNWLINLRLKQVRNPGISYFSDHTKLFHYEDDLALISEIESLLEKMP